MNNLESLGQLEVWTEKLYNALLAWGPKVVAALAILIVGYLAAKLATALLARGMRKAKTDETLVRFIRSIIYVLLLAFVAIAVLGKLGIDTTSLAAIFAAAGLAIGLALQGSLGNFASGVMLIANRPFKVGDLVSIAGVTGVVEQINVFATELNTADNKRLIVPNGEITSSVITNLTGNNRRRLDLVFGIGYADDMDKAHAILERVVTNHPNVLQDPAPYIAIHELGDSSVNFLVRPWALTGDYFKTWGEITTSVKKEFDAEGISIPFPQRDVHLHQVV
ncbi:MAG: mechanosensitive ion channel [Gammaproteobacteria bacterium]|nr:mechanosensitive ion channel [Gammaproteobacteria bacterium]